MTVQDVKVSILFQCPKSGKGVATIALLESALQSITCFSALSRARGVATHFSSGVVHDNASFSALSRARGVATNASMCPAGRPLHVSVP